MKIATTIMIFGFYGLAAFELLVLFASIARPTIAFRGVGRISSFQLPFALRPNAANLGLDFQTPACHCRVVGEGEILFMGRASIISRTWRLKGRLNTNGMTAKVVAYGSVSLWYLIIYSAAMVLSLTLGAYQSDGLAAGVVPGGIGIVGFFYYRRWYRNQVARTVEIVHEIEFALARQLELKASVT